jgi:hypothetical protein
MCPNRSWTPSRYVIKATKFRALSHSKVCIPSKSFIGVRRCLLAPARCCNNYPGRLTTHTYSLQRLCFFAMYSGWRRFPVNLRRYFHRSLSIVRDEGYTEPRKVQEVQEVQQRIRKSAERALMRMKYNVYLCFYGIFRQIVRLLLEVTEKAPRR